jgi:formate hydrogenlyase subunit 3/multisubunit Na+/H+ antiporter MnhD subunit
MLGLKNKSAKWNFSLAVLVLSLAWSIFIYFRPAQDITIELIGDYSLSLGLRSLSGLILIFVNLFGVLICIFSGGYKEEKRFYFPCLVWLVAFSSLVMLALDFITLMFGWGANLVLLYALLSLGSGKSARKALYIVGLADFLLLLGIGIYVAATVNITIPSNLGVVLDRPILWVSFILMLIGALAKAGCMPFHTWIPDASVEVPVPVMAILPASLDKFLGIYLLARICLDLFSPNNVAMGLLMVLASLTIIFAVLMALIQHDLRKLLAFHAISQVGYMVLGFATAVPIGIAGGIFHMINNAIYKSGLFLTGAVAAEKRNTFDLEKLGGLAAFMPMTFFCGLVFALSISGVPPFNGFASKWMIYQGAFAGLFNSTNRIMSAIFIFSLVAAMFGSALTLASFIKFIHAIFLGQDHSSEKKPVIEAGLKLRFPLAVLALLCILLGLAPRAFVLNYIQPALNQNIYFIGSWDSIFVLLFIFFGLALGFMFWRSNKAKATMRQDGPFIGGETTALQASFPATEFYRSIEDMPLLARIYRILKLQALDLYNILSGLMNILAYLLFILVDRLIYLITNALGYAVLGLSWFFRRLHTGLLDFYLLWSLAGLIALFIVLMLR